MIRFWTPLLVVAFGLLALPGHARQSEAAREGAPLRLADSVPEGEASATPLPLTLEDAVDRGIRNNLATVSAGQAERLAAAEHLRELARLLPTVEAYAATAQQQVNLAAFGFSGFPGVPQVIGPFALVDARATLTETLLDFEQLHTLRESSENERAAGWSRRDTRERVVLAVVDLYLGAVSAESRVAALEAQVARAGALHQRAVDLNEAGVVAGIDALRAEVELRGQEQRLIQARNAVETQKLTLARAIGLPLAQEVVLVDPLPPDAEPPPPYVQLLDRAYASRADVQELESRVRAAGEALRAAESRRLPSLRVEGNYGAIGRTPGNSHGTYALRAEIRVPLFDRSIGADVLEEDALLRQREAEAASLRGRVEFEISAALLDLDAAAQEVAVARQTQALAVAQLNQAQDRFVAGVANNVEVVLAQESVALGDEGVIRSLYTFHAARALLERATGTLEQAVRDSFGGGTR